MLVIVIDFCYMRCTTNTIESEALVAGLSEWAFWLLSLTLAALATSTRTVLASASSSSTYS
jgi:hypothetical protein